MISDMKDHPVALQLQAEAKRLRSGAEALVNVAVNRNPAETDGAHALKVGKMSRTFDKEVTASLNRSGQILREGLQDIQRRIDEKIDLKPNAFAQEIRAAFRGLDGKAKASLINQLVKENRGPELAAIVKAPSILTGISDEQRAAYENMIVTTHAAAELNERAALEDVFSGAMAAERTASELSKSLSDPSKIAEVERGAAAAAAAGEAFTQSIQ